MPLVEHRLEVGWKKKEFRGSESSQGQMTSVLDCANACKGNASICLFSEPMNSDRSIAMKMDALAIVKLIRIVIWCLTMAIDCTTLLVLVNIFLKYARSKKN